MTYLPGPSAWAATTRYVAGQVVTYSGASWMANASFTSGSSFNPSNWTFLGVREFGFPYTVDPGVPRNGDNSNVGIANGAVFVRCHEWGAITKVGLSIGASSGNICLAAYTNSGSGRLAAPTGGQIATTGAIASPGTGYREIALAATLLPGDWLALSADNTTVTFATLLASAAANDLGLGRQFTLAAAHPLPPTPSSLVGTIGRAFCMVGVA